jgi:hypothetical protein
MADSFARRSGSRADTTQGGEARFGLEPFAIVTCGEKQRGRAVAADGIARDQFGRQLGNDGSDHHVEIGDLIVQFKVSRRTRSSR